MIATANNNSKRYGRLAPKMSVIQASMMHWQLY